MESYSGQRVVNADPRSRWFGQIGTITNFNAHSAGVKYDNDPEPPATGNWTKKKLLLPVDDDNVPLVVVSDLLAAEIAKNNEVASLVAKAKESGLLSIDIHNRPATTFKTGGYVVMMVVAWTAALLAKCRRDGVEIHYKDRDGSVVLVDGSPKVLSPEDLVRKVFPKDNDPVRKNLEFIIAIRNRVVHAHCPSLDETLFGECQALLMNLEEFLRTEFGEHHGLGASLAFALQTSAQRTPGQLDALKRFYGSEVTGLLDFIGNYRDGLDEDVFNDPRFKYRILLIPVPAKGERDADAAVTFIHLDPSSSENAELLDKIAVLIRDKQIPVSGKDLLLPGQVEKRVEEATGFRFSASTHHPKAVAYFKVRGDDPSHPETTDAKYCVYDEPTGGYRYTQAWVRKLIRELRDAARYEEVVGKAPRRLHDPEE